MINDNAKIKSMFRDLGQVLWFSAPIIVTMSSQTLMQFVDVRMLAEYGEKEMAAVTPAGLVYFTIASFILGVNSCNNTFVSQSIGRGTPRECARYTIHAMYIGIMSLVLIAPMIIWAEPLFAFMGHGAAIQKLEVEYFRPRGFQLAATGMIAALMTFYQGTGRPFIPMYTGIAANVLNVVGDYALIFGHFGLPRWGIFGAGVATTLSSCFEVLLLLAIFLSSKINREFGSRSWRPLELRRVRQLLRVGFFGGLTFFMDMASWTVFVTVMLGRLGVNVLAANTAASQIMHLSLMPAYGLNVGITAIVGRFIGKRDIPGAKRMAYLGMACACAYMTFMGLMFILFRRPLISQFASDAEVVRVGAIMLTYIAVFQFADAFGIVSMGALRGAGDTKFPAMVQMLLAWLFFLPLVYFAVRTLGYGVHGAWFSATIYVWIVDGFLLWRFVKEGWRKIDIFA